MCWEGGTGVGQVSALAGCVEKCGCRCVLIGVGWVLKGAGWVGVVIGVLHEWAC